jgi:hypothetical protein
MPTLLSRLVRSRGLHPGSEFARMGTQFRPIIHPCSRPLPAFSALGLTCLVQDPSNKELLGSCKLQLVKFSAEAAIYKVSCIREHAHHPPLDGSNFAYFVSEKFCCCCYCCHRTGELAKGSMAVQAKARFTLGTDEVHKPVATHAPHAAISKLHLRLQGTRALSRQPLANHRALLPCSEMLSGPDW